MAPYIYIYVYAFYKTQIECWCEYFICFTAYPRHTRQKKYPIQMYARLNTCETRGWKTSTWQVRVIDPLNFSRSILRCLVFVFCQRIISLITVGHDRGYLCNLCKLWETAKTAPGYSFQYWSYVSIFNLQLTTKILFSTKKYVHIFQPLGKNWFYLVANQVDAQLR